MFTPDETLRRGHGSCRDFAWLLVQALRRFGLAARFVSGYSIQLKADEKPLEGPAGVAQDSADLHAWAEVYLPGAGWVGLDATSGLLAGEGHIPLACTPDPETAAAITGSFSFSKRDDTERVKETFGFEMSVRRLESPRVTAPYTEDAWSTITGSGARSTDSQLGRHAADDGRRAHLRCRRRPRRPRVEHRSPGTHQARLRDKAPLAPLRKVYATRPSARRAGQVVSGGAAAALGPLFYFRKDGLPIWQDPALFARGGSGSASASDAQRFVSRLSDLLGVDAACALPGHEDAWYYLWRERRVPANVDPHESHLDDKGERARLATIFDNGLANVVGYALPLRCVQSAGERHWETGRWFLRRERMYLVPGDSPMGYRLPLDSLPWAAPDAGDPGPQPPDPFAAPTGLCHPASDLRQSLRGNGRIELRVPDTRVGGGKTPSDVVRTALCVEPRGGVLHVFMPPVDTVEGYLSLCAALEATALELGTTIRLQGTSRRPILDLGDSRSRPIRASSKSTFSRKQLGGARGQHERALPGGSRVWATSREIHVGRPAYGNRRREPRGTGRRHERPNGPHSSQA